MPTINLAYGFAVDRVEQEYIDVAEDGAGNVIVGGGFSATVDFDPGAGVTNLTSLSGNDAFLAKYTTSGTLAWAHCFGDANVGDFDKVCGVTVDSSGNVYATGIFFGTVDFDPGPGTTILNGTIWGSGFVAKFNTNGNLIWAKSFEDTESSNPVCITVDNAGSVYTAGLFFSTTDFDPGPGVCQLTDLSTSMANTYISKLDSSGNFVFAKMFAGPVMVGPNAIVVDSAHNVYLTGNFMGTVDLDPGPGTDILTAVSSDDGYFSKLDANGNFVLGYQIANGTGLDLVMDSANNLFLVGAIAANGDLDLGPGVVPSSTGGRFLEKMDFNGNYLNSWLFEDGNLTNVALDGSGKIYLSGFVGGYGDWDFDPGPGTFIFNPNSGDYGFLILLDQAGQFLDVGFVGGTIGNSGAMVAVNSAGTIYLAGTLLGPGDFDPGPGTLSLDTNGMYVTKLVAGTAPAGVIVTESGGTTAVTEGGATDAYTVVLNSAPTANVTITLTPDSQVAVSPTSLVFTPTNWSTPRTVTVTAVDDLTVEGPHTGTITHKSASSDSKYGSSLAIADVTALITDNDVAPTAGVTITQSGGSTNVAEGGATDTYSVVLNSSPSADVTIYLNPNTQLTVSPAFLIFNSTNWNVPRTVTVTAVDDTVVEGAHSASITHAAGSIDNSYNGISVVSLTVNITDNDVPPTPGVTINQSEGSTNVAEGGARDAYTVVLQSAPTANVTISLNPDTQVTVSPTSLVFTPTSWNIPKTVTVTAVNDTVVEGPHTGTITHAAASSDSNYGSNLAIPDVTAHITDNEVAQSPGVTILQSGNSTTVIKGGSDDTYKVILNTVPTDPVTITLSFDAQLVVSPSTLIFTPLDWNVPQTVSVSAPAGGSFTVPVTDPIQHTVASGDPNYDNFAVEDVSVSLLDKTGLIVTGTLNNDNIIIRPSADLSQLLVTVNGKLSFVSAAESQLVINAGNGNDNIQLYNPIIPVFVDAGLGTDTLVVYGQSGPNDFLLDNLTLTANGNLVTTCNLENLTVNGQAENDSFTVQTTPDPSLKLLTFNGSSGVDSLTGPDGSNTWKITGSNAGLLNGTMVFATIENLVGGTDNDIFVFSPGKNISGEINGGGGPNDVLDYSQCTIPISINLQTGSATAIGGGIQNFQTILAGKSISDKLIGVDSTNAWDISGKNGGEVNGIFFQNVENLVGGSGNDTFSFAAGASITGKLDGGPGTGDILNFAGYTTPIAINLQLKKATAITGGMANIEGAIGSTAPSNTLTAPNKANTWNLTGTDAGQITNSSSTFIFSAFANLYGGAGNDAFSGTGGWSGILDGGLGIDTLTGNDNNHTWIITKVNGGTVDNRSFTSMENLGGGAGRDTFTFRPAQKITGKIDGGSGRDTLDFSTFTSAVTINLAIGSATGTTGVKNFEQFLGGTNTNNTLVAFNLANNWNLTGTNSGSFTNTSGTYTFTGFQNLTGGNQSDQFTLGAGSFWTGFLQGGLGSDTLTAFATGNIWTSTTLNGHKFGSIESHS